MLSSIKEPNIKKIKNDIMILDSLREVPVTCCVVSSPETDFGAFPVSNS